MGLKTCGGIKILWYMGGIGVTIAFREAWDYRKVKSGN